MMEELSLLRQEKSELSQHLSSEVAALTKRNTMLCEEMAMEAEKAKNNEHRLHMQSETLEGHVSPLAVLYVNTLVQDSVCAVVNRRQGFLC